MIFALITTYSTTGLILLLLLFVLYGYTKNKNSKIIKTIIILCLIPIVALCINNLLLEKQSEHEFSFLARSFDLFGGLQLFTQKPLFGYGYKNYDAFFKISSLIFTDERPCSNGFSSMLYQLGLFGSLIFIIPFIWLKKDMCKTNSKNQLYFWIFVIVMIIIIMGEPIQYMSFGTLVIGYILAFTTSKKKLRLTHFLDIINLQFHRYKNT